MMSHQTVEGHILLAIDHTVGLGVAIVRFTHFAILRVLHPAGEPNLAIDVLKKEYIFLRENIPLCYTHPHVWNPQAFKVLRVPIPF